MLRVLVERAGEVLHDASFTNEWVSVGRDSTNDVIVEDPLVSARHLTIRAEQQPGAYRLIDSSSNGTFFEGQRISILKVESPLSVQIGEVVLTLIPLARSGTARSELPRAAGADLYAPTAVDAMPTFDDVPAARVDRPTKGRHEVAAAELRLLSAGGVPRALIFEHSALIGRANECDVRLSSADISRRHCLIVSVDEGYAVKRLSKKNPVAVNSRQLALGEMIRLEDGDVITICDEELVFLFPATRPQRDVQQGVPMEAAPNVDLVVSRRACSDHAVVAYDLVGFLGAKTWTRFEEKLMLELEERRPVLLDLGYLLGLDGSGIASLSRVMKRAAELGIGIRLIRVTPRVSDLLELSSGGPEISRFICRTEQTAITRLRGEQPVGGA